MAALAFATSREPCSTRACFDGMAAGETAAGALGRQSAGLLPVTFATISDLAAALRKVAQDRDRVAFAAVYHATSAKLYGVVLRIVPQRALADEILQDVYVRIWEKAGDFSPERGSPITWMATIARNRALDEARRKPTVSLDAGEDLPEVADQNVEHPLAGRERSEQLTRLMACLGGLDADKRQLVLLAYYRGASREALSQRYSAPVATVKTWLHRSLAQLRKCLEP